MTSATRVLALALIVLLLVVILPALGFCVRFGSSSQSGEPATLATAPSGDSLGREIGGVAEAATLAYVEFGPAGLYDYMAPEVLAKCPKERFERALSDQDVPVTFRDLSDLKFDGDRATAEVVQAFKREDSIVDRTVQWVFRRVTTATETPAPGVAISEWRLIDVPGLGNCGGSTGRALCQGEAPVGHSAVLQSGCPRSHIDPILSAHACEFT